MEKYQIVLSDCHLSAGRFFENRLNPHEDFFFDDEMCDLFEYFSTGEYGTNSGVPVEVELFINGDFFDFLNVPVHGEFEDCITEEISLSKIEWIMAGHSKVMKALRQFASLPGKKITYLVGNHDADLFFPRVRERITREWDSQGEFPSSKVEIIADRDRVRYGSGLEIHHGNQFEAVHVLDFHEPLLKSYFKYPILNLPWGSYYVLKIINRLKWEREYLDKIRPIKVYVLFGLVLDPWFTLKFCFLSIFYFLKTRFIYTSTGSSKLKVTAEILKQETTFWVDLEKPARKVLDQDRKLKTIIFGHTHLPMNRVWPDGKQYINTGTWTKTTYLDWRRLGQGNLCRTFALIRWRDNEFQADLRQWVGDHSPHTAYQS